MQESFQYLYHIESRIQINGKECLLWEPTRSQGAAESEECRLAALLCQSVFVANHTNRHRNVTNATEL